jgi:hypothetical protein
MPAIIAQPAVSRKVMLKKWLFAYYSIWNVLLCARPRQNYYSLGAIIPMLPASYAQIYVLPVQMNVKNMIMNIAANVQLPAVIVLNNAWLLQQPDKFPIPILLISKTNLCLKEI